MVFGTDAYLGDEFLMKMTNLKDITKTMGGAQPKECTDSDYSKFNRTTGSIFQMKIFSDKCFWA